ncbi:MAG: stage II sporulation protein R [Clostridia bacterium]|nr:stage II sporulation protein R [Clostridia bacterium]
MVNLLKIINRENLKKLFILMLLLGIYIFISAYSYVNAVSNELENNLFRLHVIANSDSEEDQKLKYLVRDSLISYMNSISEPCLNKEEVIVLAQNHLDDFSNIAKETIINNGYNYDVQIEIGNFNFPTKTYGDISLPAGYYDALRVKIGNASGQNWWCVMFPPLCFVDITSGIVPDDSKKLLRRKLI